LPPGHETDRICERIEESTGYDEFGYEVWEWLNLLTCPYSEDGLSCAPTWNHCCVDPDPGEPIEYYELGCLDARALNYKCGCINGQPQPGPCNHNIQTHDPRCCRYGGVPGGEPPISDPIQPRSGRPPIGPGDKKQQMIDRIMRKKR